MQQPKMQSPPVANPYLDHQKKSSSTGCWIAAAVASVVLLCCGLVGGSLVLKLNRDEKSATAFADRVLRSPAFTQYDVNSLLSETAPEYSSGSNDQAIRTKTKQVFEFAEKSLGKPVSFDPTTASTNSSYVNQIGPAGSGVAVESVAQTLTPVHFQKGNGSVTMLLIERNGVWKIGSFNINLH